MSQTKKEELEALKQKYQGMINRELAIPENQKIEKPLYSHEYKQFRSELYPKHLSFYEKLCNLSEKLLPYKVDQSKIGDLAEDIETCHLDITPAGAMSFSILAAIFTAVVGGIIGFLIPLLLGETSYFLVLFFFMVAGILLVVLGRVPGFLATTWRMKSSNQLIISIFYVVTFMRHTSNLEGGIRFAAEHLSPPLSLDFRKILWDVETEKFSTVSESLESYLSKWKKYNLEFVESFHLIQGSLFEGTEARRLSLIDKSLEVILEGTYEKMLHFAHNLSSPITMLHMLGVILPVLGLVILPLVVSFMTPGVGPVDATQPQGTSPALLALYILTLYNVALPLVVYFMGQNILAQRPTGYGEMDISDNPEIKKFTKVIIPLGASSELRISPLIISLFVFAVLFLIGLVPLLAHSFGQVSTVGGEQVNAFESIGLFIADKDYTGPGCNFVFCLLDYKIVGGKETGPYGSLASLLSIFIVAAAGISVGLYYKLRSKNVIDIRNRAKELENEFASAMFQLGNRLADGFPAEIAFSKVAATMQDTASGNFMKQVSENITHFGMSVEQAIFDEKHGALVYFPSNIIQSSMKVLVQSIKKGPRVAAQALISISQYIKEIRRVDERLKDLLADVVSSMNSQISFLAPIIAGIVIGITSMISAIISKLGTTLEKVIPTDGSAVASAPAIGDFLGAGVPTYYFQIIVGLYVVQIVFILTILVNNILNGSDKLNENFLKGRNLIKSTLLYAFISFTLIFAFNLIANQILQKTAMG